MLIATVGTIKYEQVRLNRSYNHANIERPDLKCPRKKIKG